MWSRVISRGGFRTCFHLSCSVLWSLLLLFTDVWEGGGQGILLYFFVVSFGLYFHFGCR